MPEVTSDTLPRVGRIIEEHLGVEPDRIVPEADYADDLGADPLDMVELTMAFEEEFGVEITDEEAEKCTTVESSVALVDSKRASS